MADFLLSDTVDAAEALFEPIRIPWQVVVHHQIRILKIDTFPAASVAMRTRTSGSERKIA